MELEAAAPAVLPRRDGRKLARCPRLQLDTKTVTAIEQSTATGERESHDAAGASMRVKIVLSKQQLKQVAAAVAGGALPPALEQLVSVLKRQHHSTKKQAAADVVARRRRGRWSPALHSIPEECL
ncbi:unnamed protein product [Urochloa decumbens]|uniref:Uncharacterized protein n=1 Tax=Urochloa decumbens TaxID=240449 RepID=A0ABC9EDJ5_9POAL